MYKKLTSPDAKAIFRLTDNRVIPFNEENRDYRKYLEWLAQGNEPLPADEPPSE